MTDFGYANIMWITQIENNILKITSVSPPHPSLGGQYLTIYGEGLDDSINYFPITVGTAICDSLSAQDPQWITNSNYGYILFCTMRRNTEEIVNLTITKQYNNQLIIATYELTLSTEENIPIITGIFINGQDTYDNKIGAYIVTEADEFILEFTGKKLNKQHYFYAQLYSYQYITVWEVISQDENHIKVKFVSIDNGVYQINVCIDGAIAYFGDVRKQMLIVQLDKNQILPQQASYFGSILEFKGQRIRGISYQESFRISVCGQECSKLNSWYSIKCKAPQLLTEKTMNNQSNYRYISFLEVTLSADILKIYLCFILCYRRREGLLVFLFFIKQIC